jgi:hypothetical protein
LPNSTEKGKEINKTKNIGQFKTKNYKKLIEDLLRLSQSLAVILSTSFKGLKRLLLKSLLTFYKCKIFWKPLKLNRVWGHQGIMKLTSLKLFRTLLKAKIILKASSVDLSRTLNHVLRWIRTCKMCHHLSLLLSSKRIWR